LCAWRRRSRRHKCSVGDGPGCTKRTHSAPRLRVKCCQLRNTKWCSSNQCGQMRVQTLQLSVWRNLRCRKRHREQGNYACSSSDGLKVSHVSFERRAQYFSRSNTGVQRTDGCPDFNWITECSPSAMRFKSPTSLGIFLCKRHLHCIDESSLCRTVGGSNTRARTVALYPCPY